MRFGFIWRFGSIAAAILLAGILCAGSAWSETARDGPKFCNIILHNQGADSIVGLHRFVDAAAQRGLPGRMHLTIIMNGLEPEIQAGEQAFFKGLHEAGHEIGVERMEKRAAIAQWLGIPESAIKTHGAQLFGDADVGQQALETTNGFTACANACVEGDSLAEFWDIPHNWEGAPMFPYWVQWNPDNPLLTARTNRELDRDHALLELHWATRTLWHNYDRFPIPQCWHFGEPLKKKQWNVGQLVKRGEKGGWWRVELEQYEANLRLGRTPFLYINTASEGNIFTPNGPWSPMLDNDEALALDGRVFCGGDDVTTDAAKEHGRPPFKTRRETRGRWRNPLSRDTRSAMLFLP